MTASNDGSEVATKFLVIHDLELQREMYLEFDIETNSICVSDLKTIVCDTWTGLTHRGFIFIDKGKIFQAHEQITLRVKLYTYLKILILL